MKKKKIIVTVTAVAAIAATAVTAVSFSKLKNVDYTLPEGFTVTAHTGCEGEDDNTLESIRAGIKAGADIVEIDLHYLPDKTPVLSHDKPKSDAISEAVPSLESAFELLAQLDVKMNVDVKSTENISAVLSLAEKCGVKEKIFFTGVEEKDVEAVKHGAKGIAYFLNVDVNKRKKNNSTYISSLVEKVKSTGAIGINLNHKGCSNALVEAFHKENLLVSVWTANSKAVMYRCLSFSPDNITTRKPSELIQIINTK